MSKGWLQAQRKMLAWLAAGTALYAVLHLVFAFGLLTTKETTFAPIVYAAPLTRGIAWGADKVGFFGPDALLLCSVAPILGVAAAVLAGWRTFPNEISSSKYENFWMVFQHTFFICAVIGNIMFDYPLGAYIWGVKQFSKDILLLQNSIILSLTFASCMIAIANAGESVHHRRFGGR